MHRLLNVALREYTETVRTKVFIFSLFFTPALIIGIVFLSRYIDDMEEAKRDAERIAIVDRTGMLEEKLGTAAATYNAANPNRPVELRFTSCAAEECEDIVKALQQEVRDEKLDACVEIAPDILSGKTQSYLYTTAQSIEDLRITSTMRGIVQQAVNHSRFEANNLSPQLVASLLSPSPSTRLIFRERRRKRLTLGRAAKLITPFVFVGILFMSILGSSQGMLTSVIDEKNTRIVEVLLSAVSPFELMAGKILGLAAVSITVMAVWIGAGYAAAVSQGYAEYINFGGIHYFAIYYVLGFTLISATYAAIGASCNSIQESQSLMTPLMILIFSPFIAIQPILSDSTGFIATLFGFIPFTSPMVMPLRIAVNPEISALEIWTSIALLAISVPIVMWIAARIFRIGILMYGKPPSLRELARWVRQN